MDSSGNSQDSSANVPPGSSGQSSARPPQIVYVGDFPAKFPVLDDRLSVWVFKHTLHTVQGELPCWSFATDGLRAHGQKEIILTLRRSGTGPTDGFPSDPLYLFKTIYGFAERGQLADQGSYTELGPPGMFGRGDLVGLYYTAPQFPPGMDYTRFALSAILLSAEELAVGKQFGFTRMLAILGQAASYFPCPPWADPARPPLVSLEKMQAHSFLAKPVPQVRISGTHVCLEQRARLVLRLLESHKQGVSGMVNQLPARGPVVLITELSPHANACLVWQPGQTGIQAIGAPGSAGDIMAGNFVALCGECEADQLQLVEDGFMVWLTDESCDALWTALANGQPFTCQLAQIGGPPVSFVLEWEREIYHNPVDGTQAVAPGGWTRAGSPGQPIPGKRVQPAQLILLNSDDELRANLTPEDLSRYTQAVIQVVEGEFGQADEEPGQDLVLQFEIVPGDVTIRFASKPGLGEMRLAALGARLKTIPAPPVKEGPVRFQAFFWLWGGSGEPLPGP
ncbi:MAG: DUF3480 domain-containing protein [Anaerolineae bacterium]|nr:DUF3480 domain-containing protein [Anaerolineae bacterium]